MASVQPLIDFKANKKAASGGFCLGSDSKYEY